MKSLRKRKKTPLIIILCCIAILLIGAGVTVPIIVINNQKSSNSSNNGSNSKINVKIENYIYDTYYNDYLPASYDSEFYQRVYYKNISLEPNNYLEEPSITTGHKEFFYRDSSDTKYEYIHRGWYKDNKFKNEFNFKEDIIDKNTTIYAKWELTISFRIKFYDINNSSNNYELRVEKGNTIPNQQALSNYTSGGYSFEFSEWRCYNGYFVFDSTQVLEPLTFYAEWDSHALQSYTIYFETNSGSSVVNSQEIYEGGKVTKPSDPTKAEDSNYTYTFAGWYSNSGLTQQYDFDSTVSSSFTLYAKWTATAKQQEQVSNPFEFSCDDYVESAELTGNYTFSYGDIICDNSVLCITAGDLVLVQIIDSTNKPVTVEYNNKEYNSRFQLTGLKNLYITPKEDGTITLLFKTDIDRKIIATDDDSLVYQSSSPTADDKAQMHTFTFTVNANKTYRIYSSEGTGNIYSIIFSY